jgi:hypothetical protein
LLLIPDYIWLIELVMTPFASFQFFSILFSHHESFWFILAHTPVTTSHSSCILVV